MNPLPDRVRLGMSCVDDGLGRDLEFSESHEWIDHFVKQNHVGTWDVLPLRGTAVISITATTAVGTVIRPRSKSAPAGTHNSQSGLFGLDMRVTNATPPPINGFRLHVDHSACKTA